MRLFIAEKPSLARAIAQGLDGQIELAKGYIKVGHNDVVTWCIGHLLSPAEPAAYEKRYQQWRLADLPIVPETWQWTVRASLNTQFNCIKKLIESADTIVHAGDPDREGQRIVDELLVYLEVRQPVKRLLINNLEESAVHQALAHLKNNDAYQLLSESVLAREKLDWLYGLNITRAYTLLGQIQGRQGLLSIGRVQTPVLGLVVERDQKIAGFKPESYFELDVEFVSESSNPRASQHKPAVFRGNWQARDSENQAVVDCLDEQGRLLNLSVATNIASSLSSKVAIVKSIEYTRKKVNPPLLYSLSALQIDANNQLNVSASTVLAVCQKLYEKHRLITYPRSDCTYLPSSQHEAALMILSSISKAYPRMTALAQTNTDQKTSVWNDEKVGAHHAIIPTLTPLKDKKQLSPIEQGIYKLICFRYLAQFYQPMEVKSIKVFVVANRETWVLSEDRILHFGWKSLCFDQNKPLPVPLIDGSLSKLKEGDRLQVLESKVIQKQTTPPEKFTDATLLSAMLNIANFVTDPDIKQRLREMDGLGTEATRAGIIETLLRQGYLKRIGRHIISTELGQQLIAMLPDMMKTPDLTAQFESNLEGIKTGKSDINAIITAFKKQLVTLVDDVKEKVVGK